jgi:hypothetical protein
VALILQITGLPSWQEIAEDRFQASGRTGFSVSLIPVKNLKGRAILFSKPGKTAGSPTVDNP